MEITTSNWMMIAFIVAFVFSIWKMYPFLINKTLEDDDTGEDSHEILVNLMYEVLKNLEETPTVEKLHHYMTQHTKFDKEKFWRFNLNKLNQLLNKHYILNKHLSSIKDIHEDAKKN